MQSGLHSMQKKLHVVHTIINNNKIITKRKNKKRKFLNFSNNNNVNFSHNKWAAKFLKKSLLNYSNVNLLIVCNIGNNVKKKIIKKAVLFNK